MTAPFRFLFDECLTLELVPLAHSRGFDATHVKFIKRLGASDRALAVLAIDTDAVFVTNNARDFKKIYRELDLHPGLVVILPSKRWPQQLELFGAALAAMMPLRDAVNLLIEIDHDGSIAISDWSRSGSNTLP